MILYGIIEAVEVKSMKKELLAPAGDFETLKQAVHHGADAIYLGGKKFGARKAASNFNEEEMIRAISYCHLYGVKIYVTINTMIYEEELEEVIRYASFLHHHFVDAVIVQDIGLISILRKKFPNLEIHASTQLHNHNQEGLHLLEELGVKRVVVARELSLEEINHLDTTMEIECFIHGALCICYSGQCLFSSLLLSRSGNRGECAGICRLPFQLLENKKPITTSGNYLLSPKELNSMNHISELMESKVTSFKIEGRMKSPTTIGFIVSLYRKLIDNYEKKNYSFLTEEDQKNLRILFNRDFTDGFLFSSSFSNLMNIKSPNHIGYPIGKVISVSNHRIEILLSEELTQEDGIRFLESNSGMIVNYLYDISGKLVHSLPKGNHVFLDHKVFVQVGDTVMKTLDRKLIKRLEKYEQKKIPITMTVTAHYKEPFQVTVNDFQHIISKSGNFLELATKSPTTEERVITQLKKCKDTPFVISEIQIDMDSNLFIPIQSINYLRRELLQELIKVRERKTIPTIIENSNKELSNKKRIPLNTNIIYTALVRNREQLLACLDLGIHEFYTPDFSLYLEFKEKISIYYRLDRVMNVHPFFSKERLLIGELGAIKAYSKENELISDYYLNVSNHSMLEYLFEHGVKRSTLSIECSKNQVQSIVKECSNIPEIEIILYGYIEAMVMRYCPLSLAFKTVQKNCSLCQRKKQYSLKDRNGAIYPMLQSNELTHIFYHTPIKRNQAEYLSMGIRYFRFEFLNETKEEISTIIKKLRKEL